MSKGKLIFKGILTLVCIASPLFFAMPKTTFSANSGNNLGQEMKPIITFTTSQPSDGITESNFDQQFLSFVEKWIEKITLEKARNKFVELGNNPEDFHPKLETKSVYMSMGGKKFAIVKINLDNSARSVTITGVKGDEIIRVGCYRSSNHDIPVWSGECGDEMAKSFGVKINASAAISSNGKVFIDKLNRFTIDTEQDWVIANTATKTIAFTAGLPKQGIELLIDIQKLNPKPYSSQQFVDKYINDGEVEKSFLISNNNNIKLLDYKKTIFNNIKAVNIMQKQIYPNGSNVQEFYVNTFMFSVKDNLYTVGFRASVSTYNINELSKESEKIMKTIHITQ